MVQADPLQQLRDLHLPPDPGWFPPAPGWWLLVVIGIALLAAAVALARRHRWRRAPYRAARAELAALAHATRAGSIEGVDYAHGASAILKRLVVHALARPDAAALSGADWLAFLDGLAPTPVFSRGAGGALGDDRFGPRPNVDVEALSRAVESLVAHLERQA